MVFVRIRNKKQVRRLATVYVVRVAFMAAMLSAFKFAMSFIPNVEPVTLMITVYGSAMGIAYALPATLIFCAVEVAIYGAGSWVLLYFVYWPMLAVAASLHLRGRRYILATALGIVGSVLFGVLSACCDTLFCLAGLAPKHIGQYWVAYYLRGLYFDLAHVISNAVALITLYLPLVAVVRRIAPVAGSRMAFYIAEEYKRTPPEDGEDCCGSD